MEACLSHRKYCISIKSFHYSTGWNFCPQIGVRGLTHLASYSTIFILLFKTVATENTQKINSLFSLACSHNCLSTPCHHSLPCSAGLLERMQAGLPELLCWGTTADPCSLHCNSFENWGAWLQVLPSAAYSPWASLVTVSQLFYPFYTPLISLLPHQPGSSAGVNSEKFYSKGSFYCSGNYRKRKSNLVFYVAHSFTNVIDF